MMVSFLLIISFLLHLAALGAIYKLFQQIQSLKSHDLQEIDGLFEAYLQEIKTENSRLQAQLQSMKKSEQETTPSNKPAKEQKVQSAEWMENLEQHLVFTNEDKLEASLESKVLQMYSNGMVTGDIARKLNCGKTEVDIILKLHKKNV
jgi:peptidoglycan hydrolase CwlO-like protein